MPSSAAVGERPRLLFFYGRTSGPSRRAEGFLSQVLQRRRNHETFQVTRVCAETSPELLERFRVKGVPAIVIVEGRQVRARLEHPRHCGAIADALAPWLR